MIRSFLVKVCHKLPWRGSKNWIKENFARAKVDLVWAKNRSLAKTKVSFVQNKKIIQLETLLVHAQGLLKQDCQTLFSYSYLNLDFCFFFYPPFCTYTNHALHDFPSRKRLPGSMLFWEYLVLKLKTLFFVRLVLQKKILLGSYL